MSETPESYGQRQTVAHEAIALVADVDAARRAQYGSPTEEFTRVGRMWGAILGVPDVEPEKVALMMTCLKIIRESHRHKRDNLVDIIGYALTAEMVVAGE